MASSERQFYPQGVDKGRAALYFKVSRNSDAIKKHVKSIDEKELLDFIDDCRATFEVWVTQVKKAYYGK